MQYIDTGVILKVRPRVTRDGTVFLDIVQEVSSASDVPDSCNPTERNCNPRISTKKLSTEAAVQSGDTIMLAGLITDSATDGSSGIPGLSRIPVVGALFGQKTRTSRRSEVIVLLTPTIVRNNQESRNLTDEYSKRFRAMEPLNAPRAKKGYGRAAGATRPIPARCYAVATDNHGGGMGAIVLLPLCVDDAALDRCLAALDAGTAPGTAVWLADDAQTGPRAQAVVEHWLAHTPLQAEYTRRARHWAKLPIWTKCCAPAMAWTWPCSHRTACPRRDGCNSCRTPSPAMLPSPPRRPGATPARLRPGHGWARSIPNP